jgi:hypothetical protein
MDRETWLENQYRICREIMPPAPVSRDEALVLYDLLAHELDAAMIQTVPDSAGAARGGRTGYSEAGIVDRLNRVLGPGGWMTVTRVRESAKVDKRAFALVDLLLWIPSLSRFVDAVGFGKGMDMGDAEKGAITTAMKRAARMVGPGWQAYAGLIDPDLAPKDEF